MPIARTVHRSSIPSFCSAKRTGHSCPESSPVLRLDLFKFLVDDLLYSQRLPMEMGQFARTFQPRFARPSTSLGELFFDCLRDVLAQGNSQRTGDGLGLAEGGVRDFKRSLHSDSIPYFGAAARRDWSARVGGEMLDLTRRNRNQTGPNAESCEPSGKCRQTPVNIGCDAHHVWMRLQKIRHTYTPRKFQAAGAKTLLPCRLHRSSLTDLVSALFRFFNRKALRVSVYSATGYLLIKLLESIRVPSAPALHAKGPPGFEEALANVYLSAFKIAWKGSRAANGILQVAENVGNISIWSR